MDRERLAKLGELVNSAGFLFQLRVEDEIRRTDSKHGWAIESREHPWVDNKREPTREYFLDLILAKGRTRVALECKRARKASWVFLTSPDTLTGDVGRQQIRARLYWYGRLPPDGLGNRTPTTWWDFDVRPSSLESAFCVIREREGEDHTTPPQLERLARHVVDASEEIGGMIARVDEDFDEGIVIPAIVTNAALYACAADPDKISLDEGSIADGAFLPIEYIRFRKSLALRFTDYVRPKSIREADDDRERTVFVINSQHLSSTLARLEIDFLSQKGSPVDHIMNFER